MNAPIRLQNSRNDHTTSVGKEIMNIHICIRDKRNTSQAFKLLSCDQCGCKSNLSASLLQPKFASAPGLYAFPPYLFKNLKAEHF